MRECRWHSHNIFFPNLGVCVRAKKLSCFPFLFALAIIFRAMAISHTKKKQNSWIFSSQKMLCMHCTKPGLTTFWMRTTTFNPKWDDVLHLFSNRQRMTCVFVCNICDFKNGYKSEREVFFSSFSSSAERWDLWMRH